MDAHFVILQAYRLVKTINQKPPAVLGQNWRSGLPALRYYRILRTLICGNRFRAGRSLLPAERGPVTNV